MSNTATIPLTKGYETVIDADLYDELSKYRWHASINGAGQVYAVRRTNGKTVRMHRLICSTPEGSLTDHINRDSLDNRRCNLRVVTISENQWNMGAARSSSGYKGVKLDRRAPHSEKPWSAQIRVHGERSHCGSYRTAEDAARAYDAAARKHFGEFACCNFMEEGSDE